LVAWMNSCALARLAMLASSILNRSAVKASTPPAVQSTPVCRLQGRGAEGGGGGGGGGLDEDDTDWKEEEDDEGSTPDGGSDRGSTGSAGPDDEHGGELF